MDRLCYCLHPAGTASTERWSIADGSRSGGTDRSRPPTLRPVRPSPRPRSCTAPHCRVQPPLDVRALNWRAVRALQRASQRAVLRPLLGRAMPPYRWALFSASLRRVTTRYRRTLSGHACRGAYAHANRRAYGRLYGPKSNAGALTAPRLSPVGPAHASLGGTSAYAVVRASAV